MSVCVLGSTSNRNTYFHVYPFDDLMAYSPPETKEIGCVVALPCMLTITESNETLTKKGRYRGA